MKKNISDEERASPVKDRVIGVVIETPVGSRNKFKYDSNSRLFKLDKVLPEGMVFPFDFGFVPSTKCPDGDPLDVLVLMEEPTFPGCFIECKIAGVLESEQRTKEKKYRNDRLIAIALHSVLYADLDNLRDLNSTLLKQIEDFFVNYQRARGVAFTILSRQGPRTALAILKAATVEGLRMPRVDSFVAS